MFVRVGRIADYIGRYFSDLATLDTEKSFDSPTRMAQAIRLPAHPHFVRLCG
jgi:hypothetical protein